MDQEELGGVDMTEADKHFKALEASIRKIQGALTEDDKEALLAGIGVSILGIVKCVVDDINSIAKTLEKIQKDL